jgi:hypothetical protein
VDDLTAENALLRLKCEKAMGCDVFNAAVLNDNKFRNNVAKDIA